jgi:hypothetical protein
MSPTSQRRFLLHQGFHLRETATTDEMEDKKGGLYTILPNEPTVLEDEFLCINCIARRLGRLQARFAGGFVLENEPKIGGL